MSSERRFVLEGCPLDPEGLVRSVAVEGEHWTIKGKKSLWSATELRDGYDVSVAAHGAPVDRTIVTIDWGTPGWMLGTVLFASVVMLGPAIGGGVAFALGAGYWTIPLVVAGFLVGGQVFSLLSWLRTRGVAPAAIERHARIVERFETQFGEQVVEIGPPAQRSSSS